MTAQDPVADYAAWTAPESSLTVLYSIPLFQEIDLAVSDGYRRIPHGGLEIGGLLFGRVDAGSVQIEAFRLIECEHSMGPSFILSPRDIEGLQDQLAKASGDEELQGLVPLGWFISHSRGELLVSDREAILFDQLFPRPEQITVLIKPIKFQPTRFAFLLRDVNGKLNRDGTQQAIILPLPGRAGRASLAGPAPSIPAPAYQSEEPVAPPDLRETAPAPVAMEPAKPESAPPPPVIEERPEPAKSSSLPPQTSISESKPPQAKTSAAMPHALLTGTTPLRRSTDLHPQVTRSRNRGVSILVSLFILLLAVGLGFAVGYLAYSRLSFSPISLTVEDHPPVLFVSWPAGESRDADSAFIRINDGAARPLTLEEKAGGQAEVKVSGNTVKIEVLTHNWFHDARGIVRYVRPAPPPVTPAPEPAITTPTTAPAAENPVSATP